MRTYQAVKITQALHPDVRACLEDVLVYQSHREIP